MNSELENSQTFENLKRAFIEEASLAFRYKFFATIADFEGFDRLKEIFNQHAEGGTCNVHGCLDYLRTARDPSSDVPIGRTSRNLESVLQSEILAASEMYPQMAKVARDEGFSEVASWFETLEKLKGQHIRAIKEATDVE